MNSCGCFLQAVVSLLPSPICSIRLMTCLPLMQVSSSWCLTMGNSEEGKSSKSDTSSSPAPPDQANIHVYPDWAAMQAYYGPRVALPPYYNSAVASGHAPHPYMWGPPQPMMPPYGAPYAAIYSHGGVYAHPAVPIAAAHQGVETPSKSSGNTDQGLMKKLKGFDGLAMSIGNGNGNAESGDGGDGRGTSAETEGSSDGSNGNSDGGRKRSRETTPTAGGDFKTKNQVNQHPGDEMTPSSDKIVVGAGAPAVPGKPVAPIISAGMTTALELRNSTSGVAPKIAPTGVPVLPPSETWLQNERELKRERRKQSNRESARRSRLRKQAETEELAHKVESLTAENVGLKSEINQLAEKAEKLRHENAALTEKLKNGQDLRVPPVSTENLLSRVNNSVDGNTGEDGDLYERNTNSNAKLHQLLEASPRADAVAAG
ncbi:hypothetical protein Tsubulata_046604 [Turnera subulata]|uniref:BZIP domain-containing protein n=1 Tax=Turnera subulata TaxID=218843 RepID=A0A9Q0F365_9ROSI|nr:hypothetical protein Tsubulata_046604 [Turnera subulata]